jgi:hypothetical protein
MIGWLELLLCIWEIWGSVVGLKYGCLLSCFEDFPHPLEPKDKWLKLGYYCFLPLPSKFISHNHPPIHCCIIYIADKASLNILRNW